MGMESIRNDMNASIWNKLIKEKEYIIYADMHSDLQCCNCVLVLTFDMQEAPHSAKIEKLFAFGGMTISGVIIWPTANIPASCAGGVSV